MIDPRIRKAVDDAFEAIANVRNTVIDVDAEPAAEPVAAPAPSPTLIPPSWWENPGEEDASFPRSAIAPYDGTEADALKFLGRGYRPNGQPGINSAEDLKTARALCDRIHAAKTAKDASHVIPRAGDLDSVVAEALVMGGATQGSGMGTGISFGVGFADGLDLSGAIAILNGTGSTVSVAPIP
jgi:hypothetical protein